MENGLWVNLPDDMLHELQAKSRGLGMNPEELLFSLARQWLDGGSAYDGVPDEALDGFVKDGDAEEDVSLVRPAAMYLLVEDDGLTPLLEDAASVNPEDRRLHQRVKIDLSAMMYLRSDDRRNVVYKASELKDIAIGGVLLECGTELQEERMFVPGAQFELIFQIHGNEPPIRLQCQIRRVSKQQNRTSLGVAFTEPDPELEKIVGQIQGRLEKR